MTGITRGIGTISSAAAHGSLAAECPELGDRSRKEMDRTCMPKRVTTAGPRLRSSGSSLTRLDFRRLPPFPSKNGSRASVFVDAKRLLSFWESEIVALRWSEGVCVASTPSKPWGQVSHQLLRLGSCSCSSPQPRLHLKGQSKT